MSSLVRKTCLSAALIAALLTPTVASAQELTPEEEKELLEALQAEQEDTEYNPPRQSAFVTTPGALTPSMTPPASLANPEMALILDVAGAWFSRDDPQQLGAHDPNQTGFNLQQLEMHLASNVDYLFRMEGNLVFSLFGVEVEEAYATTLALPAGLQVRAGQFLNRFGETNATHPHSWNFVDQPLVLGKFMGPEGSRGLGVEGSVLLPLPWYAEWVVSAQNVEGACCARSYEGANENVVKSPADLLTTTALKQFTKLSSHFGLRWGLSYQTGPNASGQDNRTEVYGADVYLRYRPTASQNRAALSFKAELLHRRRQVPHRVLTDNGGYAQLVWNMTPQWETGARYERVTGITNDTLDPDWTDDRERITLQATFYPSHFSRFRLQAFRDHLTWESGADYGAFFALETMIGAHGAHAY